MVPAGVERRSCGNQGFHRKSSPLPLLGEPGVPSQQQPASAAFLCCRPSRLLAAGCTDALRDHLVDINALCLDGCGGRAGGRAVRAAVDDGLFVVAALLNPGMVAKRHPLTPEHHFTRHLDVNGL